MAETLVWVAMGVVFGTMAANFFAFSSIFNQLSKLWGWNKGAHDALRQQALDLQHLQSRVSELEQRDGARMRNDAART